MALPDWQHKNWAVTLVIITAACAAQLQMVATGGSRGAGAVVI